MNSTDIDDINEISNKINTLVREVETLQEKHDTSLENIITEKVKTLIRLHEHKKTLLRTQIETYKNSAEELSTRSSKSLKRLVLKLSATLCGIFGLWIVAGILTKDSSTYIMIATYALWGGITGAYLKELYTYVSEYKISIRQANIALAEFEKVWADAETLLSPSAYHIIDTSKGTVDIILGDRS
jgi:hypothetical protein